MPVVGTEIEIPLNLHEKVPLMKKNGIPKISNAKIRRYVASELRNRDAHDFRATFRNVERLSDKIVCERMSRLTLTLLEV